MLDNLTRLLIILTIVALIAAALGHILGNSIIESEEKKSTRVELMEKDIQDCIDAGGFPLIKRRITQPDELIDCRFKECCK